MITDVLNKYNKVLISTGNVLNVNKKAGQKPTEELIDCLRATLSEPEIIESSKLSTINRTNDDLREKITEHERKNIKIGAKIFLNNSTEENLRQAINNLFDILGVDYLDNLILAYHPKGHHHISSNGEEVTNGTVPVFVNGGSGESKEGVIEWGGGFTHALTDLQKLWKILEKYAVEKKIGQLGIADLDVESLKTLYTECEIHPTIVQINLSACCVVPPSLQEFCNQNDIQLLTHSDPEEILTKSGLVDLDVKNLIASWTIRYQVHVKCRGVLTAKGYIVGAEKE